MKPVISGSFLGAFGRRIDGRDLLALADEVLENDGDRDELERHVDRLLEDTLTTRGIRLPKDRQT